jgi:hypothetical protein
MNRVLGLVVQNKVVIGQSYVSGDQERMFVLGTYLLAKGTQTYLSIVQGEGPEWYPEYDIQIGAPTQSAGSDIANLYDHVNQVYRRTFDNGFVILNAQDSGRTVTVNLGGTYYLAQTSGGGPVSSSGTSTGEVSYQAVTSATLPPYSAAILLNEMPSPTSSTTTSSISTSSGTTLPPITTNTVSTSSSIYSESSSAAPQGAIPGFSIEAVLLGVILGLFMLHFKRFRKRS